ncbi:MAG TPA: PQQ-dependent sugar dehydrogenase [Micromonosporaceae bacterium]|nr:PQQ-dependent sugar dehydrogenase [Micromonosporaceae bacterium]
MRGRMLLGLGVAAVTLVGGIVTVANAVAQPQLLAAAAADIDLNPARAEVMAEGLQVPWGLGFLPDGSALVAERSTGVVSRIRPDGDPARVPAAERVATIANVRFGGEGGLLGLAVSPTYATDGFIYVCFTADTDIRIARFTLATPTSQQVIFRGPARSNIHNGGRIKFGPDGMLYATIGDANVPERAQDPASLNGKILRMMPDGTAAANNSTGDPYVYSMGHRNPQGLAWDTQGDLYAAEFGQNMWDEVNRIELGENYGWPTVEGESTDIRFRNPVVLWETWEASPSGAAFADGTLFVGALRGERLWTVPVSASGAIGTPVAELVNVYGRIRTVEVAPDGALWLATSNRDGRGTPEEDASGRVIDDRVIRFPAAGASPTPSRTPSLSPTPSRTPSTSPTVSPTPSRTPSVSPTPSRTPSTTPTPSSPPPAPSGGCAATYTLNSQWPDGFNASVTVTAGTTALTGWAVTWTFADGQSVSNAWSSTVATDGANVTARNVAYNGALAAGQSTTFGFIGRWAGANTVPTVTCTAL